MTPDLVFCLPHAGGGAHQYLSWAATLGPGIEWVPLDYPGRFTRADEPLFSSFDDAVRGLTEWIAMAGTDRRIAIFGHSLGGAIAFEVGRALLAQRTVDLAEIMISSAEPPSASSAQEHRLFDLDDGKLLRHVEDMHPTGAPSPIARQLLADALPAIRADYRLHHSYLPDPTATVGVPLLVCRGTSDTVSADSVEQWRRHSTAGTTVHHLPGGHFHWTSDHRPLAGLLRAALTREAVGMQRAPDPVSRTDV